jgi:hypothetical protein
MEGSSLNKSIQENTGGDSNTQEQNVMHTDSLGIQRTFRADSDMEIEDEQGLVIPEGESMIEVAPTSVQAWQDFAKLDPRSVSVIDVVNMKNSHPTWAKVIDKWADVPNSSSTGISTDLGDISMGDMTAQSKQVLPDTTVPSTITAQHKSTVHAPQFQVFTNPNYNPSSVVQQSGSNDSTKRKRDTSTDLYVFKDMDELIANANGYDSLGGTRKGYVLAVQWINSLDPDLLHYHMFACTIIAFTPADVVLTGRRGKKNTGKAWDRRIMKYLPQHEDESMFAKSKWRRDDEDLEKINLRMSIRVGFINALMKIGALFLVEQLKSKFGCDLDQITEETPAVMSMEPETRKIFMAELRTLLANKDALVITVKPTPPKVK